MIDETRLGKGHVRLGQNEKVSARAFLDRCTPESRRSFERGERQLRADFVEKVVDDLWEQ